MGSRAERGKTEMGSREAIDRPLVTVEAVNTVAPILYYVHTDHLHRPSVRSIANKIEDDQYDQGSRVGARMA